MSEQVSKHFPQTVAESPSFDFATAFFFIFPFVFKMSLRDG